MNNTKHTQYIISILLKQFQLFVSVETITVVTNANSFEEGLGKGCNDKWINVAECFGSEDYIITVVFFDKRLSQRYFLQYFEIQVTFYGKRDIKLSLRYYYLVQDLVSLNRGNIHRCIQGRPNKHEGV